MRIGIDATSLLCTEPRGEGKSLLRLYQEIAHLRPDFSFVLFGIRRPGIPEAAPLIPNARVVLFDCPGFRWNAWENVGLPWQTWRERIDVLHCASSGAPLWSPKPAVMTVHDLIPLLFDDGQTAAMRRAFHRRLSHGMRYARTVIAVSENTRRDLAASFPTSTTPVKVIYWGSDPPTDSPDRPVTAPYVLVLGGEAPRKNTLATLRVFAQVAPSFPNLKLVIIGLGRTEIRNRIQTLAVEYGVLDRLIMPGFVSEQLLEAYYHHAACLCYLSLYEGFGLPLLEAMAHGVPVIASNCTSIPEVVGDGGICVNPDDLDGAAKAMTRLLADSAAWKAFSERARLQANRFSWQTTALETIKVLQLTHSRCA